ncbi:MAG: Gfo/Idh/MocA family oxidoreductase [Planctomycetaceae bacterium]|nr:Gfo/Idh/MocA family oxidoreductase [Planctomycetaceae bacterium]
MAKESVTGNATSHSRRDFLKTASSLATAGVLAGGLPIARAAHASGGDVLRIGLVGCGGRGTGAAVNALGADTNCRLVAMADAFADRLDTSLEILKKQAAKMGTPQKVAVDKDHCFVGLDAADNLIRSDVDVVLLAEPPHFRPMHLQTAIEAGKHVFCEKPVAVDAPGVRSVLASAEEAKKKNLSIVSGLCWRYDQGVAETLKRVHDGAIGEVTSVHVTYLAGLLSHRKRRTDWTEMEYQLRNWQYFVWLSGDFNAEQHVHSLDKAAWAMRDEPPLRAWGVGGCLLRDRKEGDVYDHHAVVYEYANGVRAHAYCRQMPGCYNETTDTIIGTKGRAILPNKPRIVGENAWKFRGPAALSQAYDEEHRRLFAAIRSGQPLNNGLYMARSTMLAILGRMADYTGQAVTWEDAMNSDVSLAPTRYAFDAEPPTKPGPDGTYPIATPGAV